MEEAVFWICSTRESGQVRPTLRGGWNWQRPGTEPYTRGPEADLLCAPFSRETAVIPDFCTLCPMALHPEGLGGTHLAPQKESDGEVSGRRVQEKQPKPKGRLAATH